MISVIIPTYNSAQFLKKCLKALKNQSVSEKEYNIIVADDGSADNTRKITDSFNVKYVFQKHRGPAAARNLGARKSRGEIIFFIDADCVASKNLVEKIKESFSDKKISGVKGFYKSTQKSIVARYAQLEYEYKFKKVLKHKYIDFVDTYAAGYRKETFLAEGGFDTCFPVASGEDIDFSYRLSKKGYKLIANKKLIVFHHHPEKLYKYLKRKYKVGFWRPLLYKKHPDKTINDSHTPQGLKLGMILIAIIFISAVFFTTGLISGFFLFSIILIYLLTIMPFLNFIFTRDKKIVALALPITFLRDLTLILGFILGTFNLIVKQDNLWSDKRLSI